jgi:hypothetical protein
MATQELDASALHKAAVCKDNGERQRGVQRSLFLLRKGSSSVVIDRRSTTQEGSALFIGESDSAAGALAVDAISRLEDPDEGQDGEGEGGPVNEAVKVWDEVEFPSQRKT